MKGIILKDLLNLRKNLKTTVIICIFYSVLFSTLNPAVLSGIVTMLFTMQILSTFSYDDYAKWNSYALSLPISKKQLVLSKYILSLGFIISGGFFSFVIASVISFLQGNFVFGEIASSTIGTIISILFIILILLPLIFRYGVERSRIMLITIFAIPTLLILIIGKVCTALGIPCPSEEQLNQLLPLITILAFSLLIIGTYISYLTSIKILNKKEH